MLVILADRTLRDMKTFFLSNASKREFIYSNPEALSLWIEELHSGMVDGWADSTVDDSQPPDCQPLDLVRRMCNREPDMRIDSETLVRTIFDFSSPPHYAGQCCREFKITASLDSFDEDIASSNHQHLPAIRYPEDNDHLDHQQQVRDASTVQYVYPFVEDEDSTLAALVEEPECLPLGGPVMIPSSPNEDRLPLSTSTLVPFPPKSEPLTKPPQQPKSNSTEHSHPEYPIMEDKSCNSVRRVIERSAVLPPANLNALPCPWPNCKPPSGLAILYFDGPQSLRSHLRKEHQIHECSWTRLLDEASVLRLTPKSGRFTRVHPKRKDPEVVHGDGVSGRFKKRPEQEYSPTIEAKATGEGYNTSGSVIHVHIPGAIGKDDMAWGCARVPRSCYVPSFVLGGINFHQKQLLALLITHL